MLRKYLVIDLETNDLPKTDKKTRRKDFSKVVPVEIGAISVVADDDGVKEMKPWSRLVKIPTEYTMTAEACAVNGLDPAKLAAEGETLENVLSQLHIVVAGHDVIVGHNIYAFDLPILRRLDRQTIQWNYSVFHDTKLIWNAWTLGMRIEENEDSGFFFGRVTQAECKALSNLIHVRQTLMGVGTQLHRAIGDCQMCLSVYEMMRARGIYSAVMGA